METYNPGIGISAGLLMLKWDMLNNHLYMNPLKFEPGDDVNIFINFESIMKNLTLQKGLAGNIAYHKQNVVIELESAILNLVAHYRSYFLKEKCNPKVYLYYTDLKAESQQMEVYNKYYRSFYRNRYIQNPQFRSMGQLLADIVIPEIELILSYIPNCYFLKAKSFDGSVIPFAISMIQGSKNVIVSGDIFDTLYLFNPNFLTFYIKRRFKYFQLCSEVDATVQSILKNESPFDIGIFHSEMYYRLLVAIKGSKIRNIRGTFGFGTGKLIDIINDGLNKGIVLKDFSSIDSIIELFPEKYRDDMKQAFQCTDIETQYNLLSQADIDDLKCQIVDRVDMESVEALNNKRFLNYPINLQGLLY